MVKLMAQTLLALSSHLGAHEYDFSGNVMTKT